MRVEVRGLGVEVSEALRDHVERRLGFALDRFRERVETASVLLRDLNGSGRRGIDKECRIAIVLRPYGSLAARACRADAYHAVDVAAGALERQLARTLARRRTRARQPPRRRAPGLVALDGSTT